MDDWMRREIVELTATHGTVPPTWVVYDEHPYSMCWRMGGGESLGLLWWTWWPMQGYTQEQMVAYFRKWPPPHCWLTHIIEAIWGVETFDREDELPPFFERLASWGFGTQRDYERDLEDPAWLER